MTRASATFRTAATLTLLMAVGTLMPPVLGVLGPILVEELTLSRSALGIAAGTVPLVGAALAPSAGRLTDRLGGRRLSLALVVAAAAGLAVLAVTTHLVGVLVACGLAGIAIGLGNQVTNVAVRELAPPGRRSTLVGVKQSGVQLGAVLAGATLPVLALNLGWRVAVAILALAAVSVALPAALHLPRHPSRPQPSPNRRGRGSWAPSRTLGGYAFLMGCGSAAIVTYLPVYAFDRGGFGIPAAGATTGVAASAAVVARIAWTRAAERRNSPVRTLVAMSAAAVVSVAVVATTPQVPAVLWLGVVGLGTSALAWNGVVMWYVISHAPVGSSGRHTGSVQAAFLLGMFVSPLAFGLAIDVTGGYLTGWVLVGCAQLAAGITVLRRRRVLAPDPTPLASEPRAGL